MRRRNLKTYCQNKEIKAITYNFSKTNDDTFLKGLDFASKMHGRYIRGCVFDIPAWRMIAQQNPFYVRRTIIPKTESQEIDVKTLRKIIENYTEALIILNTGKNDETQVYFLPAVAKKEDGTIDPYIRRDSFLPDPKMSDEPEEEWSQDIKLSDIIMVNN